MKTSILGASLALPALVATPALAEDGPVSLTTRVVVTIENLAPQLGTFLTPVWVGFHEGIFDTYDGNTPASNDPRPGSVAMERICEDGDTTAITEDFALLSKGVDATIPGPTGPIAPGDIIKEMFVLDGLDPNHRYFSYASMIIPSNDFCVSNGSPLAHKIFDDAGKFVAEDFFVVGSEVLDAGTEVNDEVPANTAFFGQQTPNTGVDENGLIGTIGSDLPNSGFAPKGSGGILDDPRFRMADFLVPGFPVMKVSFSAAPAILLDLDFYAELTGEAYGAGLYYLREEGTVIRFEHSYSKLPDVTGAYLHLGDPALGGPAVARLLPEDLSKLSEEAQKDLVKYFAGEITAKDLVGPYAGRLLDVLSAAMKAGEIWVSIRTKAYPDGALSGKVVLY